MCSPENSPILLQRCNFVQSLKSESLADIYRGRSPVSSRNPKFLCHVWSSQGSKTICPDQPRPTNVGLCHEHFFGTSVARFHRHRSASMEEVKYTDTEIIHIERFLNTLWGHSGRTPHCTLFSFCCAGQNVYPCVYAPPGLSPLPPAEQSDS